MWKLKDFAEGNDKAANIEIARRRLEGLRAELPIIRSMEFGVNERAGDMAYDVALIMDFDSFDDLEAYLNYPPHKEISRFVKSVRESRTSVDYQY